LIDVRAVSKVFQIPHERRSTVFDRLVAGARRTHEALYALRDVTLHVPAGQSLGVMGRNGSGKSTLLRLIAGIYPPTSGTVDVRGAVSPLLDLGIGFQGSLRVRDNVALYGVLLGIPRARLAGDMDAILHVAGVTRFADARLDALSSGLRMRLAFTIAMRSEAPVLILDEALAVGDESFRRHCLEELRRLRAEGRTALFVSHDPDLVRQVCDRVVLLEAGRRHAEGTSDEMIAAYRAILAA
jgi:lipopolysaccharide transport system ATP-binding protein